MATWFNLSSKWRFVLTAFFCFLYVFFFVQNVTEVLPKDCLLANKDPTEVW
jgi:hypothetical protein